MENRQLFLCILMGGGGGGKVESTGSSKLVIVVMNTALWTCICASGFYGLVITLADIALT